MRLKEEGAKKRGSTVSGAQSGHNRAFLQLWPNRICRVRGHSTIWSVNVRSVVFPAALAETVKESGPVVPGRAV